METNLNVKFATQFPSYATGITAANTEHGVSHKISHCTCSSCNNFKSESLDYCVPVRVDFRTS